MVTAVNDLVNDEQKRVVLVTRDSDRLSPVSETFNFSRNVDGYFSDWLILPR